MKNWPGEGRGGHQRFLCLAEVPLFLGGPCLLARMHRETLSSSIIVVII
eukprot:COSAG01_NODE_29872_length_627_cov_52.816288_2_plen_48_part_01